MERVKSAKNSLGERAFIAITFLFCIVGNSFSQKKKLTPLPSVTQQVKSESHNELIWIGGLAVILIASCVIAFLVKRRKRRKLLTEQINEEGRKVSDFISRNFEVRSCPSCHEFVMHLLEISPNARSIHYACVNCKKKLRVEAGTPNSGQVIQLWNDFHSLVEQYNKISPAIRPRIKFKAPPAPLPYEQTSREPIPKAVRTEVWRRDRGCCVQCGSKENLQFDHIIPVSKGGATTVQNLQLLCRRCNLTKRDKI